MTAFSFRVMGSRAGVSTRKFAVKGKAGGEGGGVLSLFMAVVV